MKKTCLVLVILLFALLSSGAVAKETGVEELRRAMDAAQKAEGQPAGDYRLIDQDGAEFRLSEYFNTGKPLVVAFIYTSCPVVCPGITAELKAVFKNANKKYDNKFNFLVIGFDTENDTPERLYDYGSKYSADFKRFRFATSDPDTIKAMASKFGFFYAKASDGSFDHMDMATVIAQDGRIYKQVYGVRSRAEQIEARLDELIAGKPYMGENASILQKVKFFCYKYDPYTGKYVVDYAVLVAFLMQTLVVGIIIWAVWGSNIRNYFRGRSSKKSGQ